jgi:hypothetical protein
VNRHKCERYKDWEYCKRTCGTCWAFKSELKKIDAAQARRRGAELEGEPILVQQNLEPDSIEFSATNIEVNEDE